MILLIEAAFYVEQDKSTLCFDFVDVMLFMVKIFIGEPSEEKFNDVMRWFLGSRGTYFKAKTSYNNNLFASYMIKYPSNVNES